MKKYFENQDLALKFIKDNKIKYYTFSTPLYVENGVDLNWKFNYCPIIEVGDVFTRVDKNGKVWKAKVTNRTEYFVDVEKTQPYQIKVADDGLAGQCGCWHYEDAKPTTERCQLHQVFDYEDKEVEEIGLYGLQKFTKSVKVPTAQYTILIKETYSSHSKYDTSYFITKYSEEEKAHMKTVQEGIDLFYKYCEEN